MSLIIPNKPPFVGTVICGLFWCVLNMREFILKLRLLSSEDSLLMKLKLNNGSESVHIWKLRLKKYQKMKWKPFQLLTQNGKSQSKHLQPMDGIISTELNKSIQNNLAPVRCWYQMDNFFNSWMTMDTIENNSGANKGKTG